MSKGQESKFLAIFDKLYSSSGPQKPGYENGHSLGAKNKVPMFFHIERYLNFSYRINFWESWFFQTHYVDKRLYFDRSG